jgi:uncharacterized protein (TIGR02246 family)
MKANGNIALRAVACLILLTLSCTPQQQPATDTRVVDEAAIRAADNAWSKVAENKQPDGMMAYYAEDAVTLPPNAPTASGKDAIRKLLGDMFALPGFSIKWQPTKVEVARSGDMAYSQGTYQLTLNGPKGSPITDRGKYLTVWKKQSDGNWKSIVDTFSSDLPAASPTQ